MPNRTVLLGLVFLSAFAAAATAKTVVDDKVGVQVDLPDDWKADAGDRGAISTPEGFTLAAFRVDGQSADVAKDLAKALTGLVQEPMATDSDTVKVNGLAAEKIIGYGMRDGNRVRFAVLLTSKDPGGTFVVLAVGPETEFKRHLLDSDRAFDSVKAKP